MIKKNPPLYLALYKLLKYLYVVVKYFPKEHKHTLGKDILFLGWEVLDLVIESNGIENEKKHIPLTSACIYFDKLKMRLRFAYELKIVSHKRYSFLIEMNEDIGNMLFGWKKWSEDKAL
jgi:hypothetical protein